MELGYNITYLFFLIFAGTAVLATIALYTRQSLLVAYIALGAITGPFGLQLIGNPGMIHEAGDVGIIFLLFLLGLHLQPQNLFHSLRKMSVIAFGSSVIFFASGFAVSYVYGYTAMESVIVGIVTIFSSTIIGIKLLPTTILHHQHTGELLVSILLIQDIIAIGVLLTLQVGAIHTGNLHIGLTIAAFPVLLITAYLFERYFVSTLMHKFDRVQEYIFILSIGWCLCMAELAHAFGLSEEIGAFIAGVALASNPIAFYVAESLKPLRDFFLVIFFFSIGAAFNFSFLPQVFFPAATLALLVMIFKPVVFSYLLRRSGELKDLSWEIGVRLGQMSEFSLLVIYLALDTHIASPITMHMAEAATIITFIVSCYWTVMRYPTPIAANEKLRRD